MRSSILAPENRTSPSRGRRQESERTIVKWPRRAAAAGERRPANRILRGGHLYSMTVRRAVHSSAAVLIAISLCVVVRAADETGSATAIVRLQQVGTRLYRGGQPDAAGFERLKQLGIETVINLRRSDQERPVVEALGLRYVDLKTGLAPFGLGRGISPDVVRRFFEVVDDPASGPVFVHCRRGADRTGTLIAMYRIARQGWSAEAAYREARTTGMRWWHYPTLGRLREFEAQQRRAQEPRAQATP